MKKPAHNWGHDQLALDLLGHLKTPDRMVWADIQLGPQGSPRPDVYAIEKSFARPNPTAYECKISVSDFRADITAGKWSSYLEYAHRIIFAVPAGLVTAADVPEMCGLIVRHENAWRLAKRPTINPRPIAQDALLKLLIDGVHREGPAVRAKKWNQWDATRRFAEKFGAEAARYIGDAASTHDKIAVAEIRAKQIVESAEASAKKIEADQLERAPALWRDLLLALELKPDATHWAVTRCIRELREAKEGSPEARALTQVVAQLSKIVREHGATA